MAQYDLKSCQVMGFCPVNYDYISSEDRINELISFFGFTDLRDMAMNLGMRSGEASRMKILAGHSLDPFLAHALVERYPALCKSWLHYGYGPMFCPCNDDLYYL